MVVNRYIRGSLVRATGAVTLVLLLIALSNKFVSLIGKAATGELPGGLLFQMIALHIPELMALLLPLGFFLGIIFTIGRLYAENEMVALFANGVSWRVFIRAVLTISAVITLIVGTLTLWSVPKFHLFKEQLLRQHESAQLIQSMSPGRFHALKNGALVFYVEDLKGDRDKLQEVFIAEQPLDSSEAWSVLTAKRGEIDKSDEGNRYLVLSDGTRYEGKPGSNDYSVVSYETYGRLLEEPEKQIPMFNRVTPTLKLLKSTAPHHIAELQWRMALPLSTTILGLMALGISYVPPRGGRYAKVLPAVLSYIVYYNILTISKRWVEGETVPPLIGLWWVHLLALGFALCVLLSHTGYFAKLRYRPVLPPEEKGTDG